MELPRSRLTNYDHAHYSFPDHGNYLLERFRAYMFSGLYREYARSRSGHSLCIDPVGGDELEALAREVMAQPADVVERMKRLLDKWLSLPCRSGAIDLTGRFGFC